MAVTLRMPTQSQAFPILPSEVWCGWLSEFRDWVEPTTDAAVEGIFAVGSLEVGLALGRNLGIHYGRPLYANTYIALVGKTTVPRKSTILARGRELRQKAFTDDFIRVSRSVGSGEGLLELFCRETRDGDNGKISLEPVIGQRVLLDEPEFCNLLKKMRRLGTANIGEILLTLYDGEDFSPRTRNKPVKVVQPFFSLITATTPENFETTLLEPDIESGLMPRFSFFYCNPREPKAYPPLPDEDGLKSLVGKLQDIFNWALGMEGKHLCLSTEAKAEWELAYREMTLVAREQIGLASSMIARIPAITMKWALIYAAQNQHDQITKEDLARACLVGTYLMETASLVPGLIQKNAFSRIESKIVETLNKLKGESLTANGIHRLVSGRVKAEDLRRSLDALERLGVIQAKITDSGIKCYRAGE